MNDDTARVHFFELLRQRGITLHARDEAIQVEGPSWAITTALQALVDEYQDELLDELPDESAVIDPDQVYVCFDCGRSYTADDGLVMLECTRCGSPLGEIVEGVA
jgi:hypothetical protein